MDENPFFPTLATATAAAIPQAQTSVITLGRAAAGDRGGATYRKVGGNPGHAAAFRSADGAWWELTSPEIRPEMIGAAMGTARWRLRFDSGGVIPIVAGATITGGASGTTATVTQVSLGGGAWGSGTARGSLVLEAVAGGFVDDEPILIGSVDRATANGPSFPDGDTQFLRDACHAACVLKRPVRLAQSYPLGYRIFVGSRTDLAAAAGAADGFTLIGDPGSSFRVMAGARSAESIIYVQNCRGVWLERLYFDLAEATEGGGQLRFEAVDGFVVRDVRKIAAVAPPVTGGSVLSLRGGCTNGEVNGIIVRNAGEFSAAVFCTGVHNTSLENLECTGGQETLDLAACSGLTVTAVRGYGTDEVVDIGNTRGCTFRDIKGYDIRSRGITLKTEPVGDSDLGSIDNSFEDVEINGFAEFGILFGGGATKTQSLHRNKFRNVRLITPAATGATIGLALAAGDVPADPTRGFEIDGLAIEMNDGTAIRMAAIIDYRIANVRSTAPVFCIDNTPTTLQAVRRRGVWENIEAAGNFTTAHRQLRVRAVTLTGGKLAAMDSVGSSFDEIRLVNPPTDGLDLNFGNQTVAEANKDIHVRGFECINPGSAGTGYGLRVRYRGHAGLIENVHIADAHVRNEGGLPTARGFYLDNGTFDHCSLRASSTRATVNDVSWGFRGANSFNDPGNRLRAPLQVVSSGANATLLGQGSGQTILYTGNLAAARTLTLSLADPNRGQRKRIVRTGAGASGLTVRGATDRVLAQNQWCEYEFDGAAWQLVGAGTL
ncbi:MAG TPA: hypothetical protein VFX98_06775 [Longimicrobiaceae bacterium]|nr:hypothetical protein [Longimicrobiaceae bacterium]